MVEESPKTMTTALSVRCQQCGAPLQVSEALRFVTCGYCHAELEVVRDATTIHTEVLDRIEAATGALSDRLTVLELQNDLEKLDREWEAWRQRNLGRLRNGELVEPGPPTSPGTIVRLSLFVGLLSLVLASVVAGLMWSFIMGPLMGGVAFLAGRWQNAQAIHYRSTLDRFRKQRVTLMRQLESARVEPRLAA